ncbi:response regulator transcription factor [Paenibacillus silvisoli]|uniref:response regulator transcription factor n=1 Tax=Paenibacillus silvisoli TaxID=3110539 RepID=UPI002804CAEB|nr:response regulator [Paenibacillus silvisoli]
MWSILVVDDERVEREGIQYLIEENGLPLQCSLAAGSIEAMDYLAEHPVDILLTDIKMPFMDGLTLATKAKALYPRLHIIVFSAYGEFEYAKKAIDLQVLHYVLKPILLEEFLEVMNKVILLCEQDEAERKKEDTLLEGYLRSKQFEKEKAFLDVLNGNPAVNDVNGLLGEVGFPFAPLYMVVMNCRERYFESNHERFKDEVQLQLPHAEYVNLNEYQSVIFIKDEDTQTVSRERLTDKWDRIRAGLEIEFGISLCVIVGQLLQEANEIYDEFQRLDHMSDYKFFNHQGAVLFASEVFTPMDSRHEKNDSALDQFYSHLKINDAVEMETAIDKLFKQLNAPEAYSVTYVKFLCAEFVNRLSGSKGKRDTVYTDQWVNRVFQSESLLQLHELIVLFLRSHAERLQEKPLDSDKKIIQDILQTIHTRYMENISLETIAEQVYLSPGYVSGLFKKTVHQSFVKYLTAYRLEKAKEHLLNSNMKVVDIARKVGYTDTSYFGMVFRNHFGTSPAKFRGIED